MIKLFMFNRFEFLFLFFVCSCSSSVKKEPQPFQLKISVKQDPSYDRWKVIFKTSIPVKNLVFDCVQKSCPSQILPEAMNVLLDYHWPGNVRDLKSAIVSSFVNSRMDDVDLHHLPVEVLNLPTDDALKNIPEFDKLPLDQILLQAEKLTFRRALSKAKGSADKAIQFLNISKSRFYRRITELGMKKELS